MPKNNISVGRICGDPLCGLCERVCVEVKTVTDGCRSVTENERRELTITDFSTSPVYPLTFNSLYANGLATISGLLIEPTEGERSRVRFNATIPVTVYATDANGVVINGRSEVSFYKDVLLKIPADDLQPFAVESAAIVRSRVGNFVSQNILSVRMCLVAVTRITQKRELVIPAYGDCVYPQCNELAQNCRGITQNPIFTDSD